jgi:hypothetical protein
MMTFVGRPVLCHTDICTASASKISYIESWRLMSVEIPRSLYNLDIRARLPNHDR